MSVLRRLWLAVRVGQYTVGVWPFDPPRSFFERELSIDPRQVGVMIGVSDA